MPARTGLRSRQAKIVSSPFDRRRFNFELTSFRPIGLRDHSDNLIARIAIQMFQGDTGNLGASKKNHAQGERGFGGRKIVQHYGLPLAIAPGAASKASMMYFPVPGSS